jgi:N-acetylmuramoyl-L-alanine amidase
MDDLVSKIGVGAIALALWLKPVTEITASYSDIQQPMAEVSQPAPTVNEAQLEAEKKDIHCLAVMIYGEARGENFYGKAGVAWVAYNRYQKLPYDSICKVIMDTSQFHALQNTRFFTAVVNQKTPQSVNIKAWKESQKVAELVYNEIIPDPTLGSLYFVNPAKLKGKVLWLRKFKRKAAIENHHFYG